VRNGELKEPPFHFFASSASNGEMEAKWTEYKGGGADGGVKGGGGEIKYF